MSTTAAEARRAPKRDVARFLAAHEECASDFEIRRTLGLGKGLRLVCNGCGTRAAYAVAEPGVLELVDPPAPVQRQRSGRLSREEVERWLPAPAALPWWIPNAYILAIIAVGLGMIAFGLLSSSDPEPVVVGERTRPAPAVPPPAAAAPPVRPAAPGPPGARRARAGGEAAPARGARSRPGHGARSLPRRRRAGLAAGRERRRGGLSHR